MSRSTDTTSERVRELFDYDPETGLFTARTAKGNRLTKFSGYLRPDGYVDLMVDGAKYRAHRIAWLHVFGKWPEGVIDHIDRNRSNNRLANLRDVTPAYNMHNSERSGTRGGKAGIERRPSGRFRVKLSVGGKQYTVGTFDSEKEAADAYFSAKYKLHPGYVPQKLPEFFDTEV